MPKELEPFPRSPSLRDRILTPAEFASGTYGVISGSLLSYDLITKGTHNAVHAIARISHETPYPNLATVSSVLTQAGIPPAVTAAGMILISSAFIADAFRRRERMQNCN